MVHIKQTKTYISQLLILWSGNPSQRLPRVKLKFFYAPPLSALSSLCTVPKILIRDNLWHTQKNSGFAVFYLRKKNGKREVRD